MIRFDNVRVGYGQRTILRNVNFEIPPNSFVFLTGPSGSGKSSLLRLMTMELQAQRGDVHVLDKNVATLSHTDKCQMRRRIGVVLQDNPMLDHLTVRDNVSVPLLILGKDPGSFRSDVIELLEWVGLRDHIEALPTTLSVGERQRAGVARAVIGKPELIVADEPTSGLDAPLAKRIIHLLYELHRLGTTTIIATHDLQLMDSVDAPRLVVEGDTVRLYS